MGQARNSAVQKSFSRQNGALETRGWRYIIRVNRELRDHDLCRICVPRGYFFMDSAEYIANTPCWAGNISLSFPFKKVVYKALGVWCFPGATKPDLTLLLLSAAQISLAQARVTWINGEQWWKRREVWMCIRSCTSKKPHRLNATQCLCRSVCLMPPACCWFWGAAFKR